MYRVDRHPIMTGVLVGLWATPDMTLGHLLFAAGLSAYVVVGVHFEERALLRQWGDAYESYRRRVPALVPTIQSEDARRRGDAATRRHVAGRMRGAFTAPGIRALADHSLAATPDGSTIVTLRVQFLGPLRLVARVLAGLLTRQYLTREAAILRRRVEVNSRGV